MAVTSSCENEWPVVIDPSTYSVIATAQVRNYGERKGRAEVRARWVPVGSQPVVAAKVVTVRPGASVRVPFREPVSTSIMSGMAALRPTATKCVVSAPSW